MAGPGPPAPGPARLHAPVVHRGGLVERRRLQLPRPGQRRGPVPHLAEGPRACRSRTTSSTRATGATTGSASPSSRPAQRRRLREAGGPGHHDHLGPAGGPALPVDARPPASPRPTRPTSAPPSGGTTDLAAVWSDGLAATATVTLTDPAGGTDPVTVTDRVRGGHHRPGHLGHGLQPAPVGPGHLPHLPGRGHPRRRAHRALRHQPGRRRRRGHGHRLERQRHRAAIAGLTVGYGQGWTSGTGDTTPSLTVTLAGASTLDRVVVDTQSVGSVATGLRDYTLSADEPGTGWVTVATETGQYRDHEALFTFAPLVATALQVTVTEIDYGGYYGGGIPPWWTSDHQRRARSSTPSRPTRARAGRPWSTAPGLPAPLARAAARAGDDHDDHRRPPPRRPPRRTTTTTRRPRRPRRDRRPRPRRRTRRRPPPRRRTRRRPPRRPRPAADHDDARTRRRPRRRPRPAADDHHDDHRRPTTTTTTAAVDHHDHPSAQADRARERRPAAYRFKGYWLTTSNGGIFTFGQAAGSRVDLGADPQRADRGHDAPRRTSRATGWSASDGGIFTFGDAGFYGSTGGLPLNKPIVGMAATPDGKGYWLVASDGGIFAFGDAGFYGSTGGPDPQQAHRGHGRHPRRQGLLAGGVRRRHLRLRRRRLLRIHRRPRTSTSPSWAWPPPPTAAATGWPRPTAGSSPSATPGSTARPAASTLNAPITGDPVQPRPARATGWSSRDGGIFAFGDAQLLRLGRGPAPPGSHGGHLLKGRPSSSGDAAGTAGRRRLSPGAGSRVPHPHHPGGTPDGDAPGRQVLGDHGMGADHRTRTRWSPPG